MRKPRNARYKQKAYYVENDTKRVFYCREMKTDNITNAMGQSLPMADGEKRIETDSSITFKQNHFVIINGNELSIESVDSKQDDRDLNVMRGNPRFIQTLLIK